MRIILTWDAWMTIRSFILENPASIRPLKPSRFHERHDHSTSIRTYQLYRIRYEVFSKDNKLTFNPIITVAHTASASLAPARHCARASPGSLSASHHSG